MQQSHHSKHPKHPHAAPQAEPEAKDGKKKAPATTKLAGIAGGVSDNPYASKSRAWIERELKIMQIYEKRDGFLTKQRQGKKVLLQKALNALDAGDDDTGSKKSTSANKFGIPDMPSDPKESPFYHPQFNPYGYPPPGQEMYFRNKKLEEQKERKRLMNDEKRQRRMQQQEERRLEELGVRRLVNTPQEDKNAIKEDSESDISDSEIVEFDLETLPPTTTEIVYRDISHIPIPYKRPTHKSIYYNDLTELPEVRMDKNILVKALQEKKLELRVPMSVKYLVEKRVVKRSRRETIEVDVDEEEGQMELKTSPNVEKAPSMIPPPPPMIPPPLAAGTSVPPPPMIPPPPPMLPPPGVVPQVPMVPLPPGLVAQVPMVPSMQYPHTAHGHDYRGRGRGRGRGGASIGRPPTISSAPIMQAPTTIIAAPQVRDLRKEVTGLVPTALRKKKPNVQGGTDKLGGADVHMDVDVDANKKASTNADGEQVEGEYDEFMKEIQGLL